jgi:hypothetical protein
MSTPWKVLVVVVGALALVAIGLAGYALLTVDDRVDDRVGELRGPRGEQGSAGPPGAAVSGCAINGNDWDSFGFDINDAIGDALDGGRPSVLTLDPPRIICE